VCHVHAVKFGWSLSLLIIFSVFISVTRLYDISILLLFRKLSLLLNLYSNIVTTLEEYKLKVF